MMNPVLRREMKTSLRSWKMFAVLTAYVAIVTIGAVIFIYGTMFNSYNYSFDPETITGMYVVLCAIQMGLILLAAPAMTAGCISGERERQTLDLLLMTKMSPLSIVLGKLMSSMAMLILIIVATLPVFSIVFYFGGVSIFSLLVMFLFIIATACMACSISIFFSCIFKKTVVSMVVVYLLIGGVFCIATLVITALHKGLYSTMYQTNPTLTFPLVALCSNPGVGFFSLVDNQLGSNMIYSAVFYAYKDTPFLSVVLKHYWVVNFVFDIVISMIFILLAAIFVNPIRKKRG